MKEFLVEKQLYIDTLSNNPQIREFSQKGGISIKTEKTTVMLLLILNLILAVSMPPSLFWRSKASNYGLESAAYFFIKTIPFCPLLGIFSLHRLRKVPKESYCCLRRIAMGAAIINILVPILILAFVIFLVLVLYFDPPY